MTIETPDTTQSSSTGAHTPVWSEVVTLPCSLEPIQGNEKFVAQAMLANVSHLMRCSYYPGLSPKMRAVLTVEGTSRTFKIRAIIDYREKHRDLILTLEEEVPARA